MIHIQEAKIQLFLPPGLSCDLEIRSGSVKLVLHMTRYRSAWVIIVTAQGLWKGLSDGKCVHYIYWTCSNSKSRIAWHCWYSKKNRRKRFDWETNLFILTECSLLWPRNKVMVTGTGMNRYFQDNHSANLDIQWIYSVQANHKPPIEPNTDHYIDFPFF